VSGTFILASEMQFESVARRGHHRHCLLGLCILVGWIILCHVLGCKASSGIVVPEGLTGVLLAGERTRIGSTLHTIATINICEVSSRGFTFRICAQSGAHSGEITGRATLLGGKQAVFVGKGGCLISLVLKGDILEINTRYSCSWYGGVGVFFDGEYRRDVEIVQHSLRDKGIFETEFQEVAFRELTDSEYPLFLENAHLIFMGEDLDGFGATVYELGVRGLLGFMGAIMMVGQDGEVWAAVTDGDLIKYFTSEAPSPKLPQTIKTWAARFRGKQLFFVSSDSFNFLE